MIYLDHAAATPVDERVLAAMAPYFSEQFYNPSSPYAPALEVRRAYEAAKDTLARLIGGRGDEIVMTAGATESINLAVSGVGGHIVAPSIEHQAVLEAVKRQPHTLVAADEKGIISPEAIRAAITSETRLVSVALASNELGTVQPLREIAQVVRRERDHRLETGIQVPIYLHSDASQAAGQLDVHVARLGVDLLTLNAGKVYGPKQVGLLWAAADVALSPVMYGGGQERGLRSGTENIAGAVGFARALELAEKRRKQEVTRLETLRDWLEKQLTSEFPEAVVSGHPRRRLGSHLHISFPGLDAERLIFRLEARGVLVATGSACAANKGTRSHVLTAIGLEPRVADGSLRLSLGRLTTEENTARAAEIITEEIKAEYERVGKR